MKKYLIILLLSLSSGLLVQAQDDDDGSDRIRDKMREFIQKRLSLSRNEAERFTPVFLRYFKEWRETIRLNRDPLLRQQKVAELRIRYRTEFRDIVGEKRSNEIYKEQEFFLKELRDIRKERMENRKNTNDGMRKILD